MLVVFLPPLLYSAAFFSSLRDLRANVRPISFLAVGLVLATTFAVGAAAHWAIEGMSWTAALVLGAIVSPTDPVAATAIARRLGVPRRIVTVVEGESLINDGTGLVVYRFAVAAAVTGSFSLWEAGARFLLNGAGGVVVGLAVAWLVAQLRLRLDNPPVEIVVSLLSGYFAYLPAEALGVSGVLAAVPAGIYLGWRAPELITHTDADPGLRGMGDPRVLAQLRAVHPHRAATAGGARGSRGPVGRRALWYALVVNLAVVGVRIAFVFATTYGPPRLSPALREHDPDPSWQYPMLVGWIGMRGAVSLAAALALPLVTASGAPFPNRDLILFLTFGVIVFTLLVQGLALPTLVRLLDVRDDLPEEREETEARLRAAEAALARIDELVTEDWVREDTAERVRGLYDYRRRRFAARRQEGDDQGYEDRSANYMRLQTELLQAQRTTLVQLRNERTISDEVMRRIERDLDLEESRLG